MDEPELREGLERKLSRLRGLSRLLDDAVRVPGTDYRVGLDPLIGLIPGGGDLIGGLISTYIVIEAARMGVPRTLLARMGRNILLELGVGTVPLLGDLFDVTWKANARNVALLEGHYAAPDRESKAVSRWFIAGVVLVVLLAIVGTTAVSIWLVRWLLDLFAAG
jgi:hypothetical protein